MHHDAGTRQPRRRLGPELLAPTLLEPLTVATQDLGVRHIQLPVTRVGQRDHRRTRPEQFPRQRAEFKAHVTPAPLAPGHRHTPSSRDTRHSSARAGATERRPKLGATVRFPMPSQRQRASRDLQFVSVGHRYPPPCLCPLHPNIGCTHSFARGCDSYRCQVCRCFRPPVPSRVRRPQAAATSLRDSLRSPLTGPPSSQHLRFYEATARARFLSQPIQQEAPS